MTGDSRTTSEVDDGDRGDRGDLQQVPERPEARDRDEPLEASDTGCEGSRA